MFMASQISDQDDCGPNKATNKSFFYTIIVTINVKEHFMINLTNVNVSKIIHKISTGLARQRTKGAIGGTCLASDKELRASGCLY